LPSAHLHTQASRFAKKVPDLRPGYTVRVHERIQEGGKERIQIFEGLIIAMHKGHVATDATYTVRRVVSGIGVEKVFPLHSHVIDKIEVKKIAKTRRAKMYFLRGRTGKSARLIERFTLEGEFDVAPDTVETKAEEAPAAAQEAAPEVAEAAPAAEPSAPAETPAA
jgi:large subunit ribosomal protein L19